MFLYIFYIKKGGVREDVDLRFLKSFFLHGLSDNLYSLPADELDK